MATIWRTRDRFGQDVRLTEVGWEHVLERRPRMAGREADVHEVVERPDTVTDDALHPERRCYYRRTSTRRLPKVVLAFDPAGVGIVITAYPVPHVKRGEQQRWP